MAYFPVDGDLPGNVLKLSKTMKEEFFSKLICLITRKQIFIKKTDEGTEVIFTVNFLFLLNVENLLFTE